MNIPAQAAVSIAKMAPVVAALTFISSVESSANASVWDALWRIGLSSAFGVFITLLGLVYQNMNTRLNKVEGSYVPRHEYDDLKEWTKNVERKIDRLIERRH